MLYSDKAAGRPLAHSLVSTAALLLLLILAGHLVFGHSPAAVESSISESAPWQRVPSDAESEARFLAWAERIPGIGPTEQNVLASAASVCNVLDSGGTLEEAVKSMSVDHLEMFAPMHTGFAMWASTLYCPRPDITGEWKR